LQPGWSGPKSGIPQSASLRAGYFQEENKHRVPAKQWTLSERATVYTFDLSGHGQSSKGILDPTLHGLSQGLVAFMDNTTVETAHLVGHSVGGAIAMQTAIDAPGRVQSLSLIGSAGLGPEINADHIDAFISAASRRGPQATASPCLATKCSTVTFCWPLPRWRLSASSRSRLQVLGESLRHAASLLAERSAAQAQPAGSPGGRDSEKSEKQPHAIARLFL
jgi:pimeloyl-ACP methyl ester carboxylesterase